MPETLEINQLLANKYEPKRQFRWIVEIDGIDGFTARTFARPTKSHEETRIDYINQWRFLAGKGTWETLDLELYDPIAPSAAQKVMDWLRLVHDDAVGRMGYAEMYYRDFSLKLLDGLGNVVEKWNIKGAWPSNVAFGDLDYAASDAVTATMTLRFNKAIQEF